MLCIDFYSLCRCIRIEVNVLIEDHPDELTVLSSLSINSFVFLEKKDFQASSTRNLFILKIAITKRLKDFKNVLKTSLVEGFFPKLQFFTFLNVFFCSASKMAPDLKVTLQNRLVPLQNKISGYSTCY